MDNMTHDKGEAHQMHKEQKDHEIKHGEGIGGKGHEHKAGHDHQRHHAHMVADFRRRFWVCMLITIPILLLSPMIQRFLAFEEAIRFTGDMYVLSILSSPLAEGVPMTRASF